MLFSLRTLHEIKRDNVQIQDICKDGNSRKRYIDIAFEKLKRRILFAPNDQGEIVVQNNNKSKDQKQDKFIGRIVSLLSTGETGVVQKKSRRVCLVKLDKDGSVVKTLWECLYWIKRCTDEEDAIRQIYLASSKVPQISDIQVQSRVAIPKLSYQTAIVIELPARRRPCFTLQLEVTGATFKCRVEQMRLINRNTPLIGPPFGKKGRPTREEVREKRKMPPPELVTPKSKQSQEWMATLKAPKILPSPTNAQDDSSSEEEDEEEESGGEDSEIEETENVKIEKQTEFLL